MMPRVLRAGLAAAALTALPGSSLFAASTPARAATDGDATTATAHASADTSKAAAAGKKLVFDRMKGNCLACHAVAGGHQMGNVGPPLRNMKKRYPQPQLLFKRIYDETQFNPQTVMPAFGRDHALSKKEIHQIVAYLLTL